MGAVGRTLLVAARWLAFLAIFGFLCVFTVIVVSAQIFGGQRFGEIVETAVEEEADVIIVLSAGLTRESALDPFSRGRVETAVALWRAGAAQTILMSGGPSPTLGAHLAEVMKAYAVELGVPAEAVFVEGRSISTFENTRFTLVVAREKEWRRAIVVTDDFHLLRAWTLFSFWREPGEFEIVALAPASGRSGQPFGLVLTLLLRETLTYPFNMLKMAGQLGLEAVGRGDERTIR